MWIRRVGAVVQAVTYSADGRTVYTTEGARVTAWDIASREPTRLFRNDQLGASYHVNCLRAVGNRYVVLDTYARRLAWDIEAGKELKNVKIGAFCRPVGPTSTAVRFVSNNNGKLIRECDLATGKTTTVFRAPDSTRRINLFAYSPDERHLLMLTDNARAMLVTVATGKSVPVTNPLGYYANAIEYTANGRVVWVAGSSVYVCEARKPGKPLAEYTIHWPYNVFALHPSAPIFAALNRDRQLTLFGLGTGEVLRTLDMELGVSVRCVCFSPDGLTCAVGGSNKQFAVFDVDV